MMISITGASEKVPYFTALNATSTSREEGAMTSRERRLAPLKSGMAFSLSDSFAVVPRDLMCCTRRTTPVSNCGAPTSVMSVVTGCRADRTTSAVSVSPEARVTDLTRSSSTVMAFTCALKRSVTPFVVSAFCMAPMTEAMPPLGSASAPRCPCTCEEMRW